VDEPGREGRRPPHDRERIAGLDADLVVIPLHEPDGPAVENVYRGDDHRVTMLTR
jgi:hypothetical protein